MLAKNESWDEKLGMPRVTHVLAIDGFSSQTVAELKKPRTNNLVICEEGYGPVRSRLKTSKQ